jgi:proline iminopeptidase
MRETADRPDLFPAIEPHDRGWLALGGGHEMYWEVSGNPHGVPVVFLHGGPGAGTVPAHRQFFDPRHYRIVLFDQRGAGRSRPYAELRDNTTRHLIDDMERLRRHLGVDRWFVFGGSWGALLGLAYGIRHPGRCRGFVLRGVFLGRASEIDWFLNGMGTVFPEARRAFVEFLPEAERADPLGAYHRRLGDPDPAVHGPAARAWNAYESACSNLLPKPVQGGGVSSLALARIEAHYFRNRMFLDGAPVLAGLAAVRGLPAVVVQGRYDVICPARTADEIARAWPEAEYVIVPDAGHSAMEPGIRAALVEATESLKRMG